MSLTKLSLAEFIKWFPARESLESDIPAWEGENDNLFYSVPSFFLAADNLLNNFSFFHPFLSDLFKTFNIEGIVGEHQDWWGNMLFYQTATGAAPIIAVAV